ncbi:restriction endonuclease subunit S [Pseudomonas koreensis]|uniref:restriction endonuclease subunit S n=1 Tax=Pseudomonas koreensis TaxID=198620 RepID=UPI0020771351|nr:restriction endonuclease subunit S [Pseudomonas koreensis]MCM8743439.1 restriction endonuclease subunit S [Pseudomonas koreensis]
MTTLLTDNLPLLAGAPNGIKKLRELILELAVRGKLVPQDPSDEPASELLKRIAEEKTRLVAEGKIKKQKALSERDAEDPAFELPAGWAWARLADVVNVLNGRAYKKEELLDAGTPVLRVGNLFTSNHWYYSTLTLEEDKYCNPGDLLFAWSASFGPFIWHGERSIYHYHIWKLDFYAKGQLSKHYLYNYLLEQTQEIKAAGHGVSMVHMTKEKMEKLVVPVPPLAEQDRIVAKVDELMALCDRLEAQQTDAESAHAQLVHALLNSLTQASDATDFAANWQRLAEHFHTLFTTEPSIDALKQTLLQLAVMGKLVSRPTGIHSDSTSAISQQPYVLPQNWLWCEFGSTWESSFYGPRFGKEDYVASGGIPTIRTTDMSSGGLIEMRNPPQVQVPAKKLDLYKLRTGDLLVTRSGSIGTMALFLQDTLAIPSAYLIRIRFLPTIAPQFGLLYLRSPLGQSLLGLNTTSVGVPNVSATKMALFPLPLPPIDEQHRIVAKVDQLMALCDQLKKRLTQALQINEQLASTLVEQAVA